MRVSVIPIAQSKTGNPRRVEIHKDTWACRAGLPPFRTVVRHNIIRKSGPRAGSRAWGYECGRRRFQTLAQARAWASSK
jgi:hypothetical protein